MILAKLTELLFAAEAAAEGVAAGEGLCEMMTASDSSSLSIDRLWTISEPYNLDRTSDSPRRT